MIKKILVMGRTPMLGFIAIISFNSKLKFLVDLMRYFDSTPEKYDPKNLPSILGSLIQHWMNGSRVKILNGPDSILRY